MACVRVSETAMWVPQAWTGPKLWDAGQACWQPVSGRWVHCGDLLEVPDDEAADPRRYGIHCRPAERPSASPDPEPPRKRKR